MTRSSMSGSGGDRISWGWKLESLPTFFKNLRYMRPEEHATLNVIANLVLALAIVAGVAIATRLVWRRLVASK